VFFSGSVFRPLWDSPSEGFLDALPLKNYDFARDLLQKRCFLQVTAKSEQKTEKVTKNDPQK
jgi:hypothetical protein